MTIFRVPNQGQLSQPNKGDLSGNIRSSLNNDWRTNPGRIRLSPRMKVLTKDNDTSMTGMGLPIAFTNFKHTDGTIRTFAATGIGSWAGASTGRVLMSADSDYGVFANLSGNYATNQPTEVNPTTCDMVHWNSLLLVSTDDAISTMDIARLASDTWTLAWYDSTIGGTPVTDSIMNMGIGFDGNLYITNGSVVERVVPTAGSGTLTASGEGTIDFSGVNGWNGLRPIWIRSSSNRIWIGLMSWFAATGGTSKGEGFVAEWTGKGTAAERIYKIDAPCALTACVYKDTLYILDAYGILKKYAGNSGFIEVARLPVANTNIEMPGIYYAIRNDRWVHHRGMEVVNGKINILVNNFVSTGVYVEDMPSGVWEFDPENPSQGLYHKSSPCVDTDDYGQQAVEATGAIFPLRDVNGNLLAGISYYTDDTTTNRKAIFFDDISVNTNKRGSFTTPFLPSATAQDDWQEASYRFRTLPSGDKIVGKYRTGKKAHLPFIASITWTSTTTFTSTNANFQYAVVGDEIEGIMGKGASSTAHISAIAEAGGTYTITLEEAIGFTSGAAKVKVDNFKKLGVISDTNTNQDEFNNFGTEANIQIKTEMRFTGDGEIDDLTIIGAKHK